MSPKNQPASANRLLAAILFADIVGYTALMEKGEASALNILNRYLTAYNKAISNHPEHYYLYMAKNHLEYLNSLDEEVYKNNLKRFIGTYEGLNIWEENGQLILKSDHEGRKILRPISKNEMISLTTYNLKYRFLEEKGQISAIQVFKFDSEKEEWKSAPESTRIRKAFLN